MKHLSGILLIVFACLIAVLASTSAVDACHPRPGCAAFWVPPPYGTTLWGPPCGTSPFGPGSGLMPGNTLISPAVADHVYCQLKVKNEVNPDVLTGSIKVIAAKWYYDDGSTSTSSSNVDIGFQEAGYLFSLQKYVVKYDYSCTYTGNYVSDGSPFAASPAVTRTAPDGYYFYEPDEVLSIKQQAAGKKPEVVLRSTISARQK